LIANDKNEAQEKMDRQVLVFINPISGKGRARTLASDILQYAKTIGVGCVVVEPENADLVLPDLAKALLVNRFDALIAIGGDGLVHQAIQIIAASHTPIYVVPAGTGNDFARSNKLLVTNPSEIFNTIYGRSPATIDVGQISHANGTRMFAQILSTGFDAQVNERANRNEIVAGKMKYNFATAAVLPKFKAINYELEIDGVLRKLPAMLVAIANGATYGGGMQLCPMANRQDGLLDVMILHPVSKLELIKVFPKVYSGRHVTHPAVEFIQARKIKVAAQTVAYADGERIGELPITVEIAPQSLLTWVSEG